MEERSSKDPALLHMDTRLLARDMPVALGVMKEGLVVGGACVLLDIGLSGPALRVGAEGKTADLGLFAEVVHEVISRCCEDGELEGNQWSVRLDLVVLPMPLPAVAAVAVAVVAVVVVGAAGPLALSLALPSITSEDADAETAK